MPDQTHTPLVEIHISLLAHEICIATADALDLCQGVHNLALAINVGVQ